MSTEADLMAAAPSCYRLFAPHARIRADKKRVYASAAWVVADADLQAALKVIAGTVQVFGSQSLGGTISRVVPLQYPELPWLVAESFDAEACGHNHRADGAGWYSHWKIMVNFATPEYDMQGADAFLTVSTRPSGRTMEAPSGAIIKQGGTEKWADGTVFVPGYTYNVTCHKLPFFDNAYYQSVTQTVNNAAWRGAPRGTVLFAGPSATRTTVMGGVTTYDIGLDFEVSAIPWNNAIWSTGAIAPMTMNGGANLYPELDFGGLFPILNLA